LIVALPVPYELIIIGLLGVPLDVKTRPPLNVSPPSNKILSPALNVVLLTLSVVAHAVDGDVPAAPSSPEGLT
jgi:hypothetical protein